MHPDSITDYMKKFQMKYELPYHLNPHKFRHTAASLLISKGIDIVTVSAYLGHSNPTVTARIYAHLVDDALAKASDAIGEVLLE